MSVLLMLIPLGLVLLGIAIWAFVWAVNHDQFEDLDRAGHSILFDDDLEESQRAGLEAADADDEDDTP
jgi:cbb3-type cytochrome oxidase maturation protein